MLSSAIGDLLEFFAIDATIIQMAGGRSHGEPVPSIENAANELFDQLQSKIETKLEILAFNFNGAGDPVASQPSPQSAKPTKSARPPASFWDDMWASIAGELYAGTLNPRTQAEVERAMLTWIEGHGFSAATSTVRARARRLWDRLQIDE